MRLRTALPLAATGMAVVLAAGTAQALNPVDCNTDPGQECRGTDDPDLITGSSDIDLICGLRGGDTITDITDTTADTDSVKRGGGNDTISVDETGDAATGVDFVNCGSDTVFADGNDTVAKNCER